MKYVWLMIILFGLPVTAWAQSQAGAVEDVDVVETVEVVQTAQAVSSEEALTLAQITGRFHPAAVHFPIGLLVALLVVELLSLVQKRETDAGVYLAALAFAAFVVAAMTGMLREHDIGAIGEYHEQIEAHAATMIAAVVLLLLSGIWRFISRRNYTWSKQVAFMVAIFVTLTISLVGAHLGGVLVYGADYFF